MPARTVLLLAIVLLASTAIVLSAVLVDRARAAAGQASDAGACDLNALPPSLSSGDDVPLLVWPEGKAVVLLDGKRVVSPPDEPSSVAIGEHQLRVDCPEEQPFEQPLALAAFVPLGLYVTCRPAPLVVAFGADTSQWPAPSGGDAHELAAAKASQNGDLDAARKAALKAGKTTGLFTVAAAQERLAQTEKTRGSKLFTDRWNVLTERYSRAVQVVGRAAPGAIATSNSRFEELSAGFRTASHKGDLAEQAASIHAGEETLKVFVRAARAALPQDCGFQKRLTDSFESL